MFKNVASQKVIVFAFDATTNVPKTGDAANIAVYVSKDFGAVTQLGDTSATEMDATNAPGYYLFDITQTETNADVLLVSGKSSTANIKVIGAPATIYPRPANFSTLSVDSNGRVDVIKVAGTTQTARDLGASVLLSNGTGAGQISLSSGTVTTGTISNNAVSAAALAADAVDEILDDTIGDGTITVRQALRVLIAVAAGKLSGAAGTTVTIRNLADSANVIVATVDSNGNRSAVTVTP